MKLLNTLLILTWLGVPTFGQHEATFDLLTDPTEPVCGETTNIIATNASVLYEPLVIYEVRTEVVEDQASGCTVVTAYEYFVKVNELYYFISNEFPVSEIYYGVFSEGLRKEEIEGVVSQTCRGQTYDLNRYIYGEANMFVPFVLLYSDAEVIYEWEGNIGFGNVAAVTPYETTTYTVTMYPISADYFDPITRSITLSFTENCDSGNSPDLFIYSQTSRICINGSTQLKIGGSQSIFRTNARWFLNGVLFSEGSETMHGIEASLPGNYSAQIQFSDGTWSDPTPDYNVEYIDLAIKVEGPDESCGPALLTAIPVGNVDQPVIDWYRKLSEGDVPVGSGNELMIDESGTYYAKVIYTIDETCGAALRTATLSDYETQVDLDPNCIRCEFKSLPFPITIELPDSANAGQDATVCNLYYELQANQLQQATGKWCVESGPGLARFSNIHDPNSEVHVSEPGLYTFEWTVNNGGICESLSDLLNVEFKGTDFQVFVDDDEIESGDPVILNILGGQPGQQYQIDWGDGSQETTSLTTLYHEYEKGEYTITVNSSTHGCQITRNTQIIQVSLCTSWLANLSTNQGKFIMNKYTGTIYLNREDCSIDLSFHCLKGPAEPIDQVINSIASTRSDQWSYGDYYTSKTNKYLSDANGFETARLGKWREASSYIFNTDEIQRSKNYNTGTYKVFVFDWENEKSNKEEWIKKSILNKYSPNGDVVEEENALQIPSTAKFGYQDAVPYLTAQNATHQSVLFESFEVNYSGKLESGVTISQGTLEIINQAHAGQKSLLLRSNTELSTPELASIENQRKSIISFWINDLPQNIIIDIRQINGDQISSHTVSAINRTGDWALFTQEFEIIGFDSYFITIRNTDPGKDLVLDDLRIQPLTAEMNCYVYDPQTLRLLTVFDDQHFGLYYQYNHEGKLLRKLLETERGIKTIQETFYNNYN